MTFICIISMMFLSEFELDPNIVITLLFYLNIAVLRMDDSDAFFPSQDFPGLLY